jgi:flagellar biosynthesis protein
MKDTINPPDIAIALNYDGKRAPRVTAKGQGLVAEQIIERAKEHNIPLHTDVAMVKVLSKLSLGDEIPRELYVAIAEVIAFVYMLSGKQPDQK